MSRPPRIPAGKKKKPASTGEKKKKPAGKNTKPAAKNKKSRKKKGDPSENGAPVPYVKYALIGLAAIVLLAGGGYGISALLQPTTYLMRIKLNPGDIVRVNPTITTTTNDDANGANTLTTSMKIALTVKDIAVDGTYTMSCIFEELSYKVTNEDGELDIKVSNFSQLKDKSIRETYKAILTSDLSIKLHPQGVITEFVGFDAIKDSKGDRHPLFSSLEEDFHTLFVQLPPQEISVSNEWIVERDRTFGNLSSAITGKLKWTYKLEKLDEQLSLVYISANGIVTGEGISGNVTNTLQVDLKNYSTRIRSSNYNVALETTPPVTVTRTEEIGLTAAND